jgi:hypothetical protein
VAPIGKRGSLGTINQVSVMFGLCVGMILGLEDILGDSGKPFSFRIFYKSISTVISRYNFFLRTYYKNYGILIYLCKVFYLNNWTQWQNMHPVDFM